MTYRCIAIDPPWAERGGGRIKRGADRHYPLLSTAEITRTILRDSPYDPDPSGCHVWLWTTDRFLPDALGLLTALGAPYKRTLCWGKVADAHPQMGLGQYLRGAHELCLLGVVGRLPPSTRAQRSLVLAPRTLHSSKPPEAYEAIEAVSPGPRLELFARQRRPGWDCWGNQLG